MNAQNEIFILFSFQQIMFLVRIIKVGCVFQMIGVSMLLHEEMTIGKVDPTLLATIVQNYQ